MKPNLFLVVNDLKSGGTQNTIKRILPILSAKYKIQIFTFFDLGIIGNEIKEMGFEIVILKINNPKNIIYSTYVYINKLLKFKPKIILSFLYFSDFFSGLLSKMVLNSKVKVYWNVRNELLRFHQTGIVSYFLSRLNILFSKFIPSKIVYCSNNSKVSHEKIGYNNSISIVCENNIDINKYSYSYKLRQIFREKYDIPEDMTVFGMACRYDKIKNIPLFIESISHYLSCSSLRNSIFIISGENIDYQNSEILKLLTNNQVDKHVILTGYLTDMTMFYSGIDCLVVTSFSEGSPNVIYEALATGAFCITSNCSTNLISNNHLKIINRLTPEIFSDSYIQFENLQHSFLSIRENKRNNTNNTYIPNLAKLYIEL